MQYLISEQTPNIKLPSIEKNRITLRIMYNGVDGGLSCSFAFNGSSVFLFRNFVSSKEKTFALSSLALNPRKVIPVRPNFIIKEILTYVSISFMVSTGGLEPPQLSPHAPQACVSTIPPRRHIRLLY